ncbi:bacterial transcriptional activator domain-containing protein [Pseudonocardia cypriaca]|uniref:bacterial transcriptional activator domain-containing protein n=1 Tax=Pseudonocardia cypriaca TaxID=882449 RepID=UPI001151E217|nr:bacterial transcriptional activator domain-containing protein [Pseudonocardia cypriaca]
MTRRYHPVTVRGRYAEAVDVAMVAVEAEPLRESAQRVLVETHAAEGNHVEARRSYTLYRSLVRRELGVTRRRS